MVRRSRSSGTAGRASLGVAGWAGAAAVSTYGLSQVSTYWRGELVPNPFWVATGAFTALALLAQGAARRAVFVGAFAGLVCAGLIIFDDTVTGLVWPTAGNLVEAAVALVLYERVFGPVRSPRLSPSAFGVDLVQRTVLWLGAAFVAALTGALIATLSTGSTVIADRLSSVERWVVGDALGLLLVPPLVSLARAPKASTATRFGFGEVVFHEACIVAILAAALYSRRPLEFLLVPAVMWTGTRLGPRAALPTALAVALAATLEASNGWGSFELFPGDPVENVQILNYAVAIAAVVAGAAHTQSRAIRGLLVATLQHLPDLVAVTDDHGNSVRLWGPEELRALAPKLLQSHADGLIGGGPGRARVEVDGRLFDTWCNDLGTGYTLVHFRDVSSEVERDRLRRELLRAQDVAYRKTSRRISQDLHDGPVQILTAAHLQLEIAARRLGEAHGSRALDKGIDLVGKTIALLRGSMAALAVQVPSDGELLEAVRTVAQDVFDGTGVEVVVPGREPLPVDDQTAELLYQIAREALVNARMHAGASQVSVDLTSGEAGIVLEVRDDGVGVDATSVGRPGHLGVELMRQRALEAGGALHIEAGPEGGTTVRVTLHR